MKIAIPRLNRRAGHLVDIRPARTAADVEAVLLDGVAVLERQVVPCVGHVGDEFFGGDVRGVVGDAVWVGGRGEGGEERGEGDVGAGGDLDWEVEG